MDGLPNLDEGHRLLLRDIGTIYGYAGPTRCGSALVHLGCCVHAGFLLRMKPWVCLAGAMASREQRMRNAQTAFSQSRSRAYESPEPYPYQQLAVRSVMEILGNEAAHRRAIGPTYTSRPTFWKPTVKATASTTQKMC